MQIVVYGCAIGGTAALYPLGEGWMTPVATRWGGGGRCFWMYTAPPHPAEQSPSTIRSRS
jgi:hypothetical protein